MLLKIGLCYDQPRTNPVSINTSVLEVLISQVISSISVPYFICPHWVYAGIVS